jgi:hypothetical protein
VREFRFHEPMRSSIGSLRPINTPPRLSRQRWLTAT